MIVTLIIAAILSSSVGRANIHVYDTHGETRYYETVWATETAPDGSRNDIWANTMQYGFATFSVDLDASYVVVSGCTSFQFTGQELAAAEVSIHTDGCPDNPPGPPPGPPDSKTYLPVVFN